MLTLEIEERTLEVADVFFGEGHFGFVMKDGRRIEAPLWWYPALHAASPEQRTKWEILPFGDAVGWLELDEFVSAKALIIGGAAPGATPPLQAV